jgi:DNA-binding XRE family transcriptional regulator
MVPLVLNITEHRKRKGLTREQLAFKAGVTTRTIVYIEAGRDCLLSTALDIAAALGVPLSRLLATNGKKAA